MKLQHLTLYANKQVLGQYSKTKTTEHTLLATDLDKEIIDHRRVVSSLLWYTVTREGLVKRDIADLRN